MEDCSELLKCRLCLDKFDESDEMIELFSDDIDDVGSLKFCEKVEIFCGVRIRESPEMPSRICFKCYDMTRFWLNFRQMVLNSQVYLESMCTDRNIPPEIANDEQKYINFLLDDLQLVKVDAAQVDFDDFSDGDGIEDDRNDDDEADFSDHDNIIVVKNELESQDSDSEIEKMLHSITRVPTETGYEEVKVEKEAKKSIKPPVKKPTQRDLERHMKRITRPPSPVTYMCTVCGNVYNKKASFKNHMNIHSNIKPHQCEICSKKFRQVSELRNHMRRHTGEKPHQCSYCDRRFIDRSEKHRHERVHTNTRPYKCNVCDKSFAYSTILKNHQKLHSGEKDFHCLVCEKYFSLPHQLKAHLQTLTHKQKEVQYTDSGYEVVYQ